MATSRYLMARTALAEAIGRSQTGRRRAAETYVAGIARSCPGVLRNAPSVGRHQYVKEGSTLVLRPKAVLFSDAARSIERAMDDVDTAAIKRFARGTGDVHWSESALTDLVHALLSVEVAELEEAVPTLCHAAEEWVSADYKNVLERTNRGQARLGKAQEALEAALTSQSCHSPYPIVTVLHALQRGLSGGERVAVEQTARLVVRDKEESEQIASREIAHVERVLGSRLVARREAGGASSRGPVGAACLASPGAGVTAGARQR